METAMTDLSANPQAKSWERPAGASLESWMNTRIARYQTRQYDWNALKFQADYDPKYHRTCTSTSRKCSSCCAASSS